MFGRDTFSAKGPSMNEPLSSVQFWEVENTGWSGGISWFTCERSRVNPLRFTSEESAMSYALEKKADFNDPDMLWRVTYTTFTRYKNGDTCVRRYIPCMN